ncbi:MAG: hypothetical protein HKN66_09470 [Flavobacteriaceae bacterium]|nr:hypothetical protein [Flavobacteriaceae bacterium]
MKTEQELLKIMDHVDGYVMKEAESDLKEEIKSLKQCASGIKDLPYEKVSEKTDERFQKFMESISDTSKTNTSRGLRTISIITAFAAGLALLLIFNPFQNKEILADFNAMKSNPDKLSFVYELTSEKLSEGEIEEVKLLLANEENPNIKVALLDLLENYTPDHVKSEELFLNLNRSSTPSVQMAMLNAMEATDISDIRSDLDAFRNTVGLEETVKNRILQLLNNAKPKNLK